MKNLKEVSADTLRQRLRNGVVRFYFQKKDGSLREAIGTSKIEAILEAHHPQGVRQSPPSVVPFFDVEKQQWRCVSINSKMWA